MSDEQAPDFAMLRAVEILAGIYERTREERDRPPPQFDCPVLLFNETLACDVNRTVRRDVQRALGIGFMYPANGWHTYCVLGANGAREFLSLFYSGDRLVCAELYAPKSERAPALAPRNLGRFRFVPGEVALGLPITALPNHFGRVSELGEHLGAYSEQFCARFPGGAAYAMGNGGTIERLALYVLRDESSAP